MKTNPNPPGACGASLRIRTLLADDSSHILDSLREYLATLPVFQVVGTASNGAEAVDLVRDLKPDLVLMDLRMPVLDGLQACRILRRELPHTVVIIISMDGDGTAQSAARTHGAHGFVAKERLTRELVPQVLSIFSTRTADAAGEPT